MLTAYDATFSRCNVSDGAVPETEVPMRTDPARQTIHVATGAPVLKIASPVTGECVT